MKLIPSPNPKKKWRVIFDDDTHTDFGAKGYEDFTIHKDEERKKRYLKRHEKDLETNDPTKPGFLSYYILWNKPTIEASWRDYKKRFAGELPKKNL